MNERHKRESELFGMSVGAANNKLRKQIMFDLAKRLNLHFCYRCGHEIVHVDQFSVEHMNAWRIASDPVVAFFDLNNIAFSHLRCNSAAARRSPQKKYADAKERKRVQFQRYYKKNGRAWNDRRIARRKELKDLKERNSNGLE